MVANRPIGITIAAGINILIGLLGILKAVIVIPVGILLCFCNPGLVPGGVWGLIIGVLHLLFGGALWSGESWAYTVSLILAVINLVLNVISGLTSGDWGLISIAWNLFILWYLQTGEVKRYFKVG
jgi:hypothetical protein